MVNHMTTLQPGMIPDKTAARRLRDEADRLLQRLLATRRMSEERYAEAGRRDPMKSVTGRSCLDEAVEDTRRMIQEMDALLEQLNHELALAEAPEPRRPDFASQPVLGAVG